MAMGRGGGGFCHPQTQTHKVRVSPNPSQFHAGIKSITPNPYPTGIGYPQRGSGIPVTPLST
ncbi:hypothetical protein TSUD_372820 [Trifolium subterraneum]|uniref:Uncharacterized protein n=1 Tax=Trifolium subterraneum TaxID=3900 RepID=A0A2Z6NRX0_TRISU|nr:hypothetical protein TSUD_372820 [Trifolium subterraneum]